MSNDLTRAAQFNSSTIQPLLCYDATAERQILRGCVACADSLRKRLLTGSSGDCRPLCRRGITNPVHCRRGRRSDQVAGRSLLAGQQPDCSGAQPPQRRGAVPQPSPEDPATAAAQRELQVKIDQLIAQIANSTFREDFRSQQVAQLAQLKVSLAGPIEVLDRLERQNQAADDALNPLLEEATRLGRRDLARDLTIAALAYRDYYITANPSDLEIFRQQMERLGRHPLASAFMPQFAAFRDSWRSRFRPADRAAQFPGDSGRAGQGSLRQPA